MPRINIPCKGKDCGATLEVQIGHIGDVACRHCKLRHKIVRWSEEKPEYEVDESNK